MLRIAEQFHQSDVGRQRQGNEDNYFVRAPLFAIADGMGGAQAGEVASQLAVEEFEPGMPDGGKPEDGLIEIIRRANLQIYEQSRSDQQRSGMGTTCTAVYVDESEVVIGHVGDSRCYLFRNGELTRLTTDHSLVGELIDRGKLTEEQAETHPQRSVITRALGAEPEVRVDVERVEARDGDLFLLCSDGLTSMVREAALVPILEAAGSLEQAGRSLIAAANEAGGRDNITVILFRLEDVDTSGLTGEAQMTAEREAVAADPVPVAAVVATDEQERVYQEELATTTHEVPEPALGDAPSAPPPPAAATRTEEPAKAKRRRRFPVKGLIVTLVVLAIVLAGAWVATRAVFFVGVDDDQVVTIYRGVPWELPAGVDLYTTHYASGVTLDQVPASRREAFTENKLRSLDDASDLVKQAELGKLRE